MSDGRTKTVGNVTFFISLYMKRFFFTVNVVETFIYILQTIGCFIVGDSGGRVSFLGV